MPTAYTRTQRSPLLLLLFCVAGAAMLASLAFPATRAIPLGARLTIVAGALAVIASGLVFSSLTVTVDDERLAWHFGPGLFPKSVSRAEIVSAEPATTTWMDGWGIHLTGRGWLYNVAGHNAVLVALRNGKRFLLGTAEPAVLSRLIAPVLG